MNKVRRSRRDRYVTAMVVLLALIILLAAWRGGLLRPSSSAVQPRQTRSGPASPSTASTPSQPDLDGYEFLLTEERYVIEQDDGSVEVQQRRRESWRATDGWAWARQTGSDPGRFIFDPSTDWQRIRAVPPKAAKVDRALRTLLAKVPTSKFVSAEFNYAVSVLGTETLATGAFPREYRQALIDALAMNVGVNVTEHALDPKGRDSTRISLRDAKKPDIAQYLYLDGNYQYLANTTVVMGSVESGSRVVIERHHVDQIPADLLMLEGKSRVAKAFWN